MLMLRRNLLSVDGISVRRNLLRFHPLSVSVYHSLTETGILFIHRAMGSVLSQPATTLGYASFLSCISFYAQWCLRPNNKKVLIRVHSPHGKCLFHGPEYPADKPCVLFLVGFCDIALMFCLNQRYLSNAFLSVRNIDL